MYVSSRAQRTRDVTSRRRRRSAPHRGCLESGEARQLCRFRKAEEHRCRHLHPCGAQIGSRHSIVLGCITRARRHTMQPRTMEGGSRTRPRRVSRETGKNNGKICTHAKKKKGGKKQLKKMYTVPSSRSLPINLCPVSWVGTYVRTKIIPTITYLNIEKHLFFLSKKKALVLCETWYKFVAVPSEFPT